MRVVCARCACDVLSLRGTYVISLAPFVFGVIYVLHGIVVHVLCVVCDLIGFRSFCSFHFELLARHVALEASMRCGLCSWNVYD